MSAFHAPLSLSDRLRAVATLAPATHAELAKILAMLVPQSSRGNLKVAAQRAAQLPTPSSRAQPEDVLRSRDVHETPSASRGEVAKRRVQHVPKGMARVTQLPKRPIHYPSGSQPLPERGYVPKRKPLPLILPDKARAILGSLAAAPAPADAIDIGALLARIATGRPIEKLPRMTVWTLRRGVQLLVDCSPALMPVAEDVESVTAQLRRVVGNDRLQGLYFAGCPSRGVGRGARESWQNWSAPRQGHVAIILSDLGCAGSVGNFEWASTEEWSGFADAARDAGTLLVALVPYPVHRVPAALARRIAIVPWQEQLDAARAQRILRDARASIRR